MILDLSTIMLIAVICLIAFVGLGQSIVGSVLAENFRDSVAKPIEDIRNHTCMLEEVDLSLEIIKDKLREDQDKKYQSITAIMNTLHAGIDAEIRKGVIGRGDRDMVERYKVAKAVVLEWQAGIERYSKRYPLAFKPYSKGELLSVLP